MVLIMGKGLTILIVVAIIGLIIVSAVPLIPYSYSEPFQVQVPYTVQVSYTEQVPYTEQEPYTITETYTEQEAYEVQIPYDVEVDIIETELVYEDNRICGKSLYLENFYLLSRETVLIEWTSEQTLLLFGLMKESTWNKLRLALLAEFGLAVIGSVFSGGTIGAAVASALPALMVSTLAIVATADDYYTLNIQHDTNVKSMPAGNYKVIMINLNANNLLSADISYRYETTETQTRYRTETEYRTVVKERDVIKYRTVTKYRTETKYRDETKYRTETQYREVTETVTILEYLMRNR